MDVPPQSALLSQATRARLFETLLRMRRSADTEELASALGLHVNGVRRQLERMHRAGLLERSQASRGRGRPRDVWSIASDAQPAGGPPEAYAELAGWLARAIPPGPGRLRQVERTGREIGRELAPDMYEDLGSAMRQVFSALGFQPQVETGARGTLRCSLSNCPYRRSVRENPDVVCTLHKGITKGVLEELDPDARLTAFEPRDPVHAGCVMEVREGSPPNVGRRTP